MVTYGRCPVARGDRAPELRHWPATSGAGGVGGPYDGPMQPGPIATDMNPDDSAEFASAARELIALGQHGQPLDIASAVSYLAGPESGFVTGTTWNILDGGFVVKHCKSESSAGLPSSIAFHRGAVSELFSIDTSRYSPSLVRARAARAPSIPMWSATPGSITANSSETAWAARSPARNRTGCELLRVECVCVCVDLF